MISFRSGVSPQSRPKLWKNWFRILDQTGTKIDDVSSRSRCQVLFLEVEKRRILWMRTAITCWIPLLVLLVGIATQQQEEVVRDRHIFAASHHDEWNFGSTTAMGGGARAILKNVLSVEQAEGVGARVRRSIGGAEVRWDRGGIPYANSAFFYHCACVCFFFYS